jgi:hypothetical protein
MNNFNLNSEAYIWIQAYWPGFVLLALWTVFWKGLALWHSARRGQGWWFIIFLLVNTAGVLELVYLFGVIKLKLSELFSKNNRSSGFI